MKDEFPGDNGSIRHFSLLRPSVQNAGGVDHAHIAAKSDVALDFQPAAFDQGGCAIRESLAQGIYEFEIAGVELDHRKPKAAVRVRHDFIFRSEQIGIRPENQEVRRRFDRSKARARDTDGPGTLEYPDSAAHGCL